MRFLASLNCEKSSETYVNDVGNDLVNPRMWSFVLRRALNTPDPDEKPIGMKKNHWYVKTTHQKKHV